MNRLIFLICCMSIFATLAGQTPTTPAPPVIIRTTVDHNPDLPSINIYWRSSPTPGVTYYKVSKWHYTGNNPVPSSDDYADNIPGDSTHYETVEAEAAKGPLGFQVVAYIDAQHFSVGSRIDSTIFLTDTLNECEAQLKLHWNINWNWKGNISSHTIYLSYNGGPFTEATTVPGDATQAIVNIKRGGTILAYVLARRNNAAKDSASSQCIRVKSNMANIPAYMNADYGTVASGSAIVRFTIDPQSELTEFKLVRSKSPTGPFETIQTYNTDVDSISYADHVNTDKDAWYYKILAVNECGNEVDSSNIAGTVLLKAVQNETDVTLNWTPYEDWVSGVKTYVVQRKFGDADYITLNTTTNNSYQDHIDANQNVGAGSLVYYRIMARENSGNPHSSGNNTSVSNEVRVELNPNIRFKFDAFIPGSASNNTFYPVMDFIPESFTFKIFNRWGNLVFETNDPYNPVWDGTMNGKLVEQGVYTWQIQYSNSGEKTHVTHGTVTVIIP